MKKLCPITISNYFYKKYNENDLMKLNMLTYLSYCWYLKLSDKKLTFELPILTKYGIMFNSILNYVFQVKRERKINDVIPYKNFTPINDDVSKLLDKIWGLYGQKDSVYLSALCMKDRKGLVDGDYIPNKVIIKNYRLKDE